jgi:hypothetical protein
VGHHSQQQVEHDGLAPHGETQSLFVVLEQSLLDVVRMCLYAQCYWPQQLHHYHHDCDGMGHFGSVSHRLLMSIATVSSSTYSVAQSYQLAQRSVMRLSDLHLQMIQYYFDLPGKTPAQGLCQPVYLLQWMVGYLLARLMLLLCQRSHFDYCYPAQCCLLSPTHLLSRYQQHYAQHSVIDTSGRTPDPHTGK